jgi:hypothetical protein
LKAPLNKSPLGTQKPAPQGSSVKKQKLIQCTKNF